MWPERRKLIAAIEAKRKSRLICYLTSDRQNATAIIAKDALPYVFAQLKQIGEVPRIDLLVSTPGGDTLAAFNVAQAFREYAKWVGVLIPLRCFSAGTLLALGANEIYMTHAGTLSPIDPSVTTQLNPIAEGQPPGVRQLLPVSVESVAGFKSLITEDWKITDEAMLVKLFDVLAEKVHPLALGDVYRSRQQIERLARQLLERHRRDETKIKEIITTLTRGLGSHDYPISRTEARGLFGKQMAKDDAELETLVMDLYQDYSDEMKLAVPYNPAIELASARESNPTPPGIPTAVRVTQKLAIIESSGSQDVYDQTFLLTEGLVAGPTGPMKAVQQEIVEASWKHHAWKE
jgi:hypothetical protein